MARFEAVSPDVSTESVGAMQPFPAEQVLIAIPAHNEARFIGSLVLQAKRHVARILVVDDGSSDKTAEIALDAGADVVRHEVNKGKAAAVATAFRYARENGASALVLLDGDGQHSLEDLPRLLKAIEEDAADMVIGSRFLTIRSQIPRWRIAGQWALTSVTNVASGTRVTDSQSGYRAFSRRAIEAFSFGRSGFSVESEMQFQARQHGLRVLEVPISVHYGEPMKRNPFLHGLSVLEGIAWLVSQNRPLAFFGIPGLVVLLAGLVMGVIVVRIYEQTMILAVGYALITVLLVITGLLSIFTGLTLYSIRQQLNQRG